MKTVVDPVVVRRVAEAEAADEGREAHTRSGREDVTDDIVVKVDDLIAQCVEELGRLEEVVIVWVSLGDGCDRVEWR